MADLESAIDEFGETALRIKAQRDDLIKTLRAAIHQFALIERLAVANGPIKRGPEKVPVSKHKAIALEARAAIDALNKYIENQP